ncbi:cation transport protein-domain-containing protein [Apodospora peruviana]|uniref:Potassium transport protein n=1 Tax=Apodospora peruviana TaxID=516989 RepID=A0AAE0M7A0_9PEZI|nr:cation transport protein-domain-containing protein [Apodospora peruviana]
MFRQSDLADDYPRAARLLSRLRSSLPPWNFITIHYAYFIVVCLLTSVIFWASSNPAASISYTDSLFLVVSAMTEAGLNTVNLSQMTTWQQVLLFLLIIAGSSIWVSIWTVVARKHVFEKRFHDIVRAERLRRANRTASALSLPRLQRFMSFRKTQTPAAIPRPTTAAGQERRDGGVAPDVEDGRLAVRHHASRSDRNQPETSATPSTATGGDDAAGPSDPIATSKDHPQLAPNSPGHIAFADEPHPNAEATKAGATTTGAHYFDHENRPTRRMAAATASGVAGDNEKAHFTMSHFLAHRAAGRNAQFHDLTSEEREELGGCEYRALKVLAVIVPVYFFLWQLLGCVALGAWIHNNQPETPLANGIKPWWLGIFNGASAFNNSGMSLLDANMVPFQNSTFVLLTMGLLILAGNTAYPIFLRLIVWSTLKFLTLVTADADMQSLKDTLRFILNYPRRVYTNLFPSRQTGWLLFMLILLNSVDWAAFELLNLGNPAIENIPKGFRVLDGLFQALAVRSGGFYVVPIPSTYIGLQLLYVIMMYISVYPVVITMRHSNVYEERSLGIYAEDSDDTASPDPEMDPQSAVGGGNSSNRFALSTPGLGVGGGDGTAPLPSPYYRRDLHPGGSARSDLARRISHSGTAATLGRAIQRTFTWHGVGVQPPPSPNQGPESRISFISQQIHGQLAHDIWWLVLATLVIVIIETGNFLADPVTFSVFNVIFEVVSAYGCVGISVGLPNESYSFCGSWHVASKLVLCAVMIRGRHRGLPVALDRAVRLPGERLHQEEEEDYRIRRSMTNRRVSVDI